MNRQSEIELFTREFLAYRPILEKTVNRILRCGKHEIDDVLQDVWIKGARAVAGSGIQHHKSWLWRTASNEAMDRLRLARRCPIAASAKDDEARAGAFEAVDRLPGPFDRLARYRDARRVTHALMKLPEKQRAILLSRYLDLEPFEKISVRTGTPIETLRSRMFRAFGVLRVMLADLKQAA